MTFRGINNTVYTTGAEIGKGGEGTVYLLDDHPNLVLKQYSEPLSTEKQAKLKHMVAITNAKIEAYAAWPVDLVHDNKKQIVGFVMRRLNRYVPIHMLFSPMDRKKMFADKGYNFLVHVARNLAVAFFQLHNAGLIIGDVNEGNILVDANGMIGFIDCDSFQVRDHNSYYYCEVGVPRYTPPELLKMGTFENVVRTINTDSFSLSVLIFQLLFLGRHPFAGKNKSAVDINEETAIKNHQFAYSLDNRQKQLFPPDDSFDIKSLSTPLIELLHRSFEREGNRPSPADWANALEEFGKIMVTCKSSKLHTYPSTMTECPWCSFRKRRGILYFLDDNYLKGLEALNDIESFVNGFKLEKISFAPLTEDNFSSTAVVNPIDPQYYQDRNVKIICYVAAGIIAIAIPFFFDFKLIFIAFILGYINYHCPWTASLRKELRKRRDIFYSLKSHFYDAMAAYNNAEELNVYDKDVLKFNNLIDQFRKLPEELQSRRKSMEEKIYMEQLSMFLRNFNIKDHTIPTFGPAKKQLLYNNGIMTASDISKLNTVKIQGIGPKNYQVLVSWQRQLATKFLYMPDTTRINAGFHQILKDIALTKIQLEVKIRQQYKSLHYLKNNIVQRQKVLESQVNVLAQQYFQAQVDYGVFTQMNTLLR